MPEKALSTSTKYSSDNSKQLLINTFWDETVLADETTAAPNTLSALIFPNNGSQHARSYNQGELAIHMKNNPLAVDFELDDMGNLICNCNEAKNYSINDEGNLIYNFPD